MYEIDSYMDSQSICYSKSSRKEQLLDELVELSYKNGKIKDLEGFRKAIQDREKIISTGIGLGIAVPHAKLAGIDEFFITVGLPEKPVEWESIDDEPVSFVFMIGGPADRQNDYLGILSKLVLFSKNEARRSAMLSASSPEEVIRQFVSKD
ncbi:MAG: PTS sugar transporter subunit IIA [Spirochaetales bacterium]|nr:PTS sugar transporter subunit IIA [Spirochaetales bacterium]